MATMKDVAKIAGVSHGTVSNVLNGGKGVSLEKVKRVQKAMMKLGYKPNAVARNLKLNKTMQIDLIIPNIIDSSLSQIYESLSMFATENGYTANLQITNEDPELETKFLNQALMYNKDGVILMTCQPNNTALFENLMLNGLKLVFIGSQLSDIDHNFVGLDVKNTVAKITGYLLEKDYQDIAILTGPTEYTFEVLSLTGYIEAHIGAKKPIVESHCGTAGYDRQAIIKEAFRMLEQKPLPKVIIATSHIMINPIIKAMELLNIPEESRPLLFAMVPYSWSLTKRPGVIYITLPYVKVAELAYGILMEDINTSIEGYKNTFIKVKTPNIEDLLEERKFNFVEPKDHIRVLLTENLASLATRTLLPEFKKRTGIQVEIDVCPYFSNYLAVKNEWFKENYDVFGIDIPWLPELAQKGVIENLDDYIDDNRFFNDVPMEIFNDFSMVEGSVFSIPYTICAQQLFYRKDLFADIKNQRLFFEQYKKDLVPPVNWKEFNEVARFFTKKFNSDSPTIYGTTLGAKMSSGAVCEFLPRLWSFGAKIFENSSFTLNSEKAVEALENYKESFQYASEGSWDNWWVEQVTEFSKGDVAMMVLFADQISDITVRSKSKVNGKIGYADIPGGIGTLGGWTMAVNAYSKKKESAFQFIQWACSQEMSVMNTILGGNVPCQTAMNDIEVSSIYPWLKKNVELKRSSKLRRIPKKQDGTHMSEHEFEEILGEAVYNTITNQIDAKTALNLANEKLNTILKK